MGRSVNVLSGLDGAMTSTTAMLTPQKEGGDTHQVLSVLRSYWQLVAAEGQKKLFFFEIVTLIGFPHSSGWPTPMHIWAASAGLLGYQAREEKRRLEAERELVGERK